MDQEERKKISPLSKISEAKTVGELKEYVELYSINKSFVEILKYDRKRISAIYNSTFSDETEFLPLLQLSTEELEKHRKKFAPSKNTPTKKKKKTKEERYEEERNYHDYYEKPDSYYAAIEKNQELVYDLAVKRKQCLGIGTNKLKRRLNKISDTGRSIAYAYRLAFEIEDVNIQAKGCWGKYRTKKYDQKTQLINDLIILFDQEGWIFGFHNTDNYSTNHIIFFEIPGCEQISFHTNINTKGIPRYEKEWDGKTNSTLDKLCDAIAEIFPDIIY